MVTHLMKKMATYLMKLCLIEYGQCEQKAMKKGIQHERNSACANSMMKKYVSWYTRIGLGKVAYARGKERAKSRMG